MISSIGGVDMAVLIEFGYLPEGFAGYARQPHERTVEGEILRALTGTGAFGDQAGIRTSSRTDRGVGAFQNYFVCDTHVPGEELVRRLDSMIKGAFFFGAGTVEDDFNPRHAIYREYVFFLPKALIGDSIETFRQALSLFRGTHNFRNFTKKDRTKDDDHFSKERAVDRIRLEETSMEGMEILTVTFRARSFLYQQIRKMMAAAVMVAEGKLEPGSIEAALEPGAPEGRFSSFPANGLFLARVKLPEDIEKGIERFPYCGKGLREKVDEAALRFHAVSGFMESVREG